MNSFLTSGTPAAIFVVSMIAVCVIALVLALAMHLGDITARRHRHLASGAQGGCGTDLCHCMQAMASRHQDEDDCDAREEQHCCHDHQPGEHTHAGCCSQS